MTPRLDISGEIGANNATSAAVGRFCDANPGPVDVFINSFGGIATEGAAIFASLQRHGQATAYVQGIAASAASLAMLGARKIVVHEAAMIMLHEPGSMAFGTAGDLRATADVLDKLTAVYAGTYARATGNPVDRVAQWMRHETWLAAEEAVALNFADAVDGASAPAPVARFDYTRFKAAPAPLLALALKNGWATVSPDIIEKDKK